VQLNFDRLREQLCPRDLDAQLFDEAHLDVENWRDLQRFQEHVPPDLQVLEYQVATEHAQALHIDVLEVF
jgi:hypothetical protein